MGTKVEGVDLQLINNSPCGAHHRGSKSGETLPTQDEDNYDPHIHRKVPKATTYQPNTSRMFNGLTYLMISNFETLVHLLKGSLGTGILAMPQAFYYSGMLTGGIATVIIGIICTYCLHVLVNAQYELCKRKKIPLLSYPESMQLALEGGPQCLRFFARPSNIIVDVFMITYQLGICCVYIVFVAENIKTVCDPHMKLSVEVHMLILLGPLIAINCIRNLKILAPFSTLANLMTFVGLGIIVYYLIVGLPPADSLEQWNSAYTFPLFFGTTLFALEAVGVVIALENNMKSPKSFGGWCGVLNVGMIFIVVLYVIVGMLGYARYGKECKGSVTLNLPDEPLAQSVKIIFAIAIFITYGLQCYVPVDIIWRTYMLPKLQNSLRQTAWEYALRIGLVLITFVLAVAIPRLSLFISLFGAFCLSALGISFPALIELCVKYPDNFGPFKYILIKDILLFIFGIIGLVVGTYTTLSEIVKSFQTHP